MLITGEPAQAYGCSTKVSKENQPLISRTAIIAKFLIGDFEFVGLSIHVRFNSDGGKINRDLQREALCRSDRAPRVGLLIPMKRR